MPRMSSKTSLLDKAGYKYNLERMMFINRLVKKAFSVEFIDDEPESKIKTLIQKPNVESDWLFFTNLPMSEGTRKELKRVLQQMAGRSIEDRLREQYFDLLPRMARVAQSFTTEIEYPLRLLRKDLATHESLVVKTRIKDCSSAIDKLRRREPGGGFDRDMPEKYSLLGLRDLVGVRILVFPSKRAVAVDQALRGKFRSWKSDPVVDRGKPLAFKYNGLRFQDRIGIPCEYQIVSSLIGLFWEVEHAAIYKQALNLKALGPLMKDQTTEVYKALKSFEVEFEKQLQKSELELS